MFIIKHNQITCRINLLKLFKRMDDLGSCRKKTLATADQLQIGSSTFSENNLGNNISTSRMVSNEYKQESINNLTDYVKTRINPNILQNKSFNSNDRITYIEERTHQKFNENIGMMMRGWDNTTLDKRGDGKSFKLLSYNVLAQDLLEQHQYLYRRNNPANLMWNMRWKNLYNEIVFHDADIICLQEVQHTHLFEYYRNQFEPLGYAGIYKKRTNDYPDGCAILYKSSEFLLIDLVTVEYQQDGLRLLDRNNVGVIAKFAPITNVSQEFIVATTHLLYNPRRADVRVAQVQLLLAEIERFSYKSNNEYLPVILCGDFNSRYDSEVINYITKASIAYPFSQYYSNDNKTWIAQGLGVTDTTQHINILEARRNIPNKLNSREELMLLQTKHSERNNSRFLGNKNFDKNYFGTGWLTHVFNFKSVYDVFKGDDEEGTTFQDKWITVDYIFYSVKKSNKNKGEKIDDKLILQSKYSLPRRSELNNIHIPNENLGSDHLALLAKFKLKF